MQNAEANSEEGLLLAQRVTIHGIRMCSSALRWTSCQQPRRRSRTAHRRLQAIARRWLLPASVTVDWQAPPTCNRRPCLLCRRRLQRCTARRHPDAAILPRSTGHNSQPRLPRRKSLRLVTSLTGFFAHQILHGMAPYGARFQCVRTFS